MKIGKFLTIVFSASEDGEAGAEKFNCDGPRLKLHDSIIGSIILLSDVNELEQVIAIISLFLFRNCIHVILESESSRLNANMETLFAKRKRATTQRRAEIFAALLISRCIAETEAAR